MEQDKNYYENLELTKSDKLIFSVKDEYWQDYNFCLDAVKLNVNALDFISEELKDYNIYLEAIKKDCMVIEEVPNNLIGELYLIAEKHGYDIFRLDVLMPRKKLK